MSRILHTGVAQQFVIWSSMPRCSSAPNVCQTQAEFSMGLV